MLSLIRSEGDRPGDMKWELFFFFFLRAHEKSMPKFDVPISAESSEDCCSHTTGLQWTRCALSTSRLITTSLSFSAGVTVAGLEHRSAGPLTSNISIPTTPVPKERQKFSPPQARAPGHTLSTKYERKRRQVHLSNFLTSRYPMDQRVTFLPIA